MNRFDQQPKEMEMGEKNGIKQNVIPDEKSMILGSLVPNLVLENIHKKTHSFLAVLLFADVSGFTELCDKYSKNSIRASSQITEIINIYIGEMVKVVYEFKGDVVNFSGDAFLALWEMADSSDETAALRAADCAIYIQERVGEYVTQVNTLKVKLALTAGLVNYLVVGDNNKKDFILLGETIMALKKTEKYCGPGQTLVTASLISFDTKKRYKFESVVPNEIWRIVGHKYGVDLWKLYDGKFKQQSGGVDYLLNLRPPLRIIKEIDSEIKLFMMGAVNKGIEMTGRVEQMTEMRNVVIVFINIITSPETEINYLTTVIESCYLKISRIVIKLEGAVNKLSLFDKDLMFLVIFGLRYYKSSMTEKTALKGAWEMKEELEKEREVRSASIGVTSGTVYCGVVGHPVRREFTVMGLTVNMAARLMVAYQNVIVCDRETFLHSRIDYKNFVLQEPKSLKGISNVGPVYMFLGHEKDDEQFLRTTTNLPLLGREKEIDTFEYIMKKAFFQRNAETKTIMTVMGESGQGKTRMLEEVRIICQEKCLCLLVELQQSSLEIPYSGIQEICRGSLGLTETSTIYERESRLYNLLKGEEYKKEFICLLNRVFNVNFMYTTEYYNADAKIREIQLRKLIVLIMKRLTIKPTVLIIDNSEYMDSISWMLLNDITKLPRIVTVMGIGTKAELFPFARQFLKKKNVKLTKLGRIDQEYLIGLACQMLSVEGIPYDLLGKIQKDSEGNPGWVEGFLLVCIQTGLLYFRDVKTNLLSIHKMVKAPVFMLERGYDHRINKLVSKITTGSMIQNEPDTIKACFIEEDFKQVKIPIVKDLLVMNVFDRFPNYVKQILKYCAALGNIFPREMLEHLLGNHDSNQLSNAVKVLFELKILGCATSTHAYDVQHKFVMRKRLLNFSSDNKVECVCPREPDANKDNSDLPNYAFCQFFRFVTGDFKSVINLILTHGEKKEFHTKIVLYLQNQDKQCSACKKQVGRWNQKGIDNVLFGQLITQDIDKPGKLLLSYLESANEKVKPTELTGICVTRTLRFSVVNLSDCQCHLIMLKLNDELIYHCLEGELLESAVNSILDNGILYLSFSDVLQASCLIDKAADYLSQIAKHVKEPYIWKISCTSGLINLMRGLCKLTMGHIKESIDLYLAALVDLGYYFPQTDFKIWLKTKIECFKMKFVITHLQSSIGKRKGDARERVTETLASECLSFLSRSYGLLYDWKRAKLAAVWALNKALYLGNNFFVLCYALGSVFNIATKIDSGYFFDNLKEFAEQFVCMNTDYVNFIELRSVLYMYKGIIFYTLSKGELEEAVEYTHVALNISLPVQKFETKLRLIPKMVLIYIFQLEIHEAVLKLVEYESIMNSDVDSSSRTWYLALIMYINLYCGLELISFQEAESFLNKSGKLKVVKDLESEMTLVCCMWLYALRRRMWKEARLWIPKSLDEKSWKQKNPTMVNLMIFEGLLLQFSRVESINQNINLVKKIIYFEKEISDVIDEELMWKPRYQHLVAYRYRLEYLKPLSKRSLISARNLADSQGNRLESLTIVSDYQSWTSELPTGHNIQSIQPVQWKGTTYNRVTVYNLPLEEHFV